MNLLLKSFITGSLAVILASCTSNTRGKIDVSVSKGYPVIQIANAGGHGITIGSSDPSAGSIGFVSDGVTSWLKGKPEISYTLDGNIQCKWQIPPSDTIILDIINEGDDVRFSLHACSPSGLKISAWFLNIKSDPDEYFTGIFERVVDGPQNNSWADGITEALNLRGQRVDVRLKPTVSAYSPFYISSSNYGFFNETTWPGVIDFCSEDPGLVKVSFEGPSFCFKIYTDDNPLDIVRRHALDSGPSFVPPSWAFGPWRWRDEHSNSGVYYDGTTKKAPYNTDIVEDILMMKAFDIPCTAYWIDRPWAVGPNGFDDYEFDTSRFPDPAGMIKWLNDKDIELMIWIGPFVMGKMATYAEENNYSQVSKMHGNNPGQVLMDFTNPEAVKWWGENGPAKMAKMGIRGFKLDRADGEKLTDSLHLKTYAGISYRENYNDFPRQYVKATYDAIKPVLGDNFMLFPRSQYTGSSKYGGMWAGDTDGKPEGLRSAIIGLQRCSVMGYPVWASDIGGYWGTFSRETAMRWLAFGCFSPIMEVGPTNNTGFWNNPGEPRYDTELIATWRLYAITRLKLADYVSRLAAKAASDGTPIVLPLFLAYPEQKEAWNDWQTYMFGPDILVSPIWQPGLEETSLYLPAGETWIDAWSPEKEYEGGEYLMTEAPLHKIPVFIRKGSGIDLGNLNELYSESQRIAAGKPDLVEMEKKEGWR